MKLEWPTVAVVGLGLAAVVALVLVGHQNIAAAIGGVTAVVGAVLPSAVRPKLPSERDTDPQGVK